MGKYDFSKVSVLVVGDVILDEYLWGSVDRISPEAPVPVVNIKRTILVPGGAANVANNIASLEGKVLLIGAAGDDYNGEKLASVLDQCSIKHLLFRTKNPTITKVRVIGNKQQMVRLDYEKPETIPDDIRDRIKDSIIKCIDDFDVVVISDYNKGVCSEDICRYIIAEANKRNIPVVIDPKGNDWKKYSGATLVTPNMKEFNEFLGDNILNDDALIEKWAPEAFKNSGFKNLLITRSEKGMTLFDGENIEHFPTFAKEVYDVSGAGDTVIAALAASIASGSTLRDSVEFANMAAGIVVGKLGTVPIRKEDLFRDLHLSYNKIINYDDLSRIIESLKTSHRKIVFTNGCFDILHIGHVKYLEKAKELGDVLILGLNTDNSVRRNKGEDRPVNKEDDRAAVLSGLASVDYIILFDDDTPFSLIEKIRPDYLVKGGDYRVEDVVGKEFADEVVLIDFVEGYSTSKIITRLRSNA
jgi:D-beta-D-heptose 7-phosphate kinase/D-beta-D-heptose 1-phosphate adenosyltransferase